MPLPFDDPQTRSPAVISARSPLRHPRIEDLWIAAAAAIGWRVERAASAYASADGGGVITIGVDEILDHDDAAAQLIFHELCHGLIEGPERWSVPDWGLCNADDRDVAREHACLRLQVYLTEPHALRELMAPTTEYRAYHDALAGDPLQPASDAAAAMAATALARAASRRWIEIIDGALAETRATLDAAATTGEAARAGGLHPAGFAFAAGDETCGTCAWLYVGGRGKQVERCRQSAGGDGNGRRTAAGFRGCVRWEPKVECQACGACCREAYHSVTVSVRDPVVWKQPALVVRTGHRFEILREGERCAALGETAPPATAAASGSSRVTPPARFFACRIYEDRPRACRDFEAGGRHCLVARRRVGLTP
ncbi:MAG: YkgJ family cysteine cluster protein [Pseudomonadota bacterium]